MGQCRRGPPLYRRRAGEAAGDAAGVTCVPTTGFVACLPIGLPFASIRSTYLQPGRNTTRLHARRIWRSGVENCIAVLLRSLSVSRLHGKRKPRPAP